MSFFRAVKDRISGRAPKGAKRSPEWSEARRRHLNKFPRCAVCGTDKKLEIHHIYPFHIFPEKELDPHNLITLCDGGGKFGMKSCHRFFGHLGNWQNMNINISEDARLWSRRLFRE